MVRLSVRNVVLVGLVFFSAKIAMGERYNRNSRWGGRGSIETYSRSSQSQQSYSNQGSYSAEHVPGASRYSNGHEVVQRYQVSGQFGRAAGSFGDRGSAERVYHHDEDPLKVRAMEEKEAYIERFHRDYVEETAKTYRTLSDVRTRFEPLRSRLPSGYISEQARAEDNLLRLQGIYRDLHREAVSGR